jgi:lysophospholipase L1-like esterase
MKRLILIAAVLVGVSLAPAQQRALLSGRQAGELLGRTVQLMESTSVASPELMRAGAPVLENAKQSLEMLRTLPNQSAITYVFLSNAKAYLTLADAVPKPYPFPEEAGRQLAELRDSVSRIEAHFRALLDQKEIQLRNPDRDNLSRYAEADAKVGPPVSGRPRVVFLGDSITDGWRLNEYFPDRDFINRGISGQITGEMLGRMKADVIDLKPAAMIVLAGTNDIARGVPLKAIEDNLTMIADLADVHKIKPLFASVLPVSDYHKAENPQNERSRQRPPETIRALNSWLMNFCRQRNYLYVDYFTGLVDKAGFLRADVADDGLHPNSAGYRIMAPMALASIGKVAAEAPVSNRRKK